MMESLLKLSRNLPISYGKLWEIVKENKEELLKEGIMMIVVSPSGREFHKIDGKKFIAFLAGKEIIKGLRGEQKENSLTEEGACKGDRANR